MGKIKADVKMILENKSEDGGGTPRKDTWISMLFGTGKDKFATSSVCSVLRLTIKE